MPLRPEHQRSHNLLLLNKILRVKDVASPVTLVLDDVELSGRRLARDVISRVQGSRKIIYVSWGLLDKPKNVDSWIDGYDHTAVSLQKALSLRSSSEKHLIVLDSPSYLFCRVSIPTYLSSLVGPSTALLTLYHPTIPSTTNYSYAPNVLQTLSYLATTILTVHSGAVGFARKTASDRALEAPRFGLDSEREGSLFGTPAAHDGPRGYIVEMEHRRPSGRPVCEVFFLPHGGETMLLAEHPAFRGQPLDEIKTAVLDEDITFELGLTREQMDKRKDVLLPYFDAQTDGGDGGRIIYQMGREDDWDDEEDEI